MSASGHGIFALTSRAHCQRQVAFLTLQPLDYRAQTDKLMNGQTDATKHILCFPRSQ